MTKKLICILLSIIIVCGLTVVGFADEISAYDLSLARTNAAYDYLNEVYLSTNLGNYIEYATQKDIDTLQRFADDLVRDCNTDEEKCQTICKWVNHNVGSWITNDSYAPIDVFRTLKGVCSGQSQLMSALMKLCGIEASVSRGYLIDTTNTTVEKIYSGVGSSHEWVMAYYDNDWHLYDSIWGEYGNNDREDIASKYYFVNVDGISAYTEEMDMTKDEFTYPQTIYKDGEFIGIDNGEITKLGSASLSVGGCLRYAKIYYTSSYDAYYKSLSNAENTKIGYAINGGYYQRHGGSIFYVKENGILLGAKVEQYGDKLVYLNEQSGVYIDGEIDNNGMTNGSISAYVGEEFDLSTTYPLGTTLISLNQDIAVVDGLKINVIGEGKANIRVVDGNSTGSLYIYSYGDYRYSKDLFKEYCGHEETHTGRDECEYCDYCGMLIEKQEMIITETDDEFDVIIEENVDVDIDVANSDGEIDSGISVDDKETPVTDNEVVEEFDESPTETVVDGTDEQTEINLVEEEINEFVTDEETNTETNVVEEVVQYELNTEKVEEDVEEESENKKVDNEKTDKNLNNKTNKKSSNNKTNVVTKVVGVIKAIKKVVSTLFSIFIK